MADWKKHFWKNTFSSYVGVVVRMVLGLVVFRQMYEYFSSHEFGYWSLLWSLFGYGILLDFGFGFTAQKAVAEKTATGDTEGMNRILSTIFWTYGMVSVVLLGTMLAVQSPFLGSMDVLPGDREAFNRSYVIFFVGMALVFPLGIFPEILRGLQRIDLANWAGLAATLCNATGILLGIHLKWDFSVLMAISVISSLLPNGVIALLVMKHQPHLSFSPKLFEWRAVRAQMGFSATAYLITFSNLLMAKTDQLVITAVLGVSAVALYQAGYKMAEMLNTCSVQLQAALSPAAASLNARGDAAGLRELLIRSSRMTFLVVTPLYFLSAVYLRPLIQLLTGMESVSDEIWWVGQALLLAIYSGQLSNGCTKRILVMCGEEKWLLRVSLTEGLANVVLSVALAYRYGVLGVAIGTLVPAVLVGWVTVIPATLKRLQMSFSYFVREHFQGAGLPLIAGGIVLAALTVFAPFPEGGHFFDLAWRGLAVAVPVFGLGIGTIRNMTK